MAQALYRRWRSQAFEQVVGQEHVTLTLRNALRDGHMSHAYLFTGPRGTGKTSTARILAKAINCTAEDVSSRPDGTCSICTAIAEGRLLDLIEIDAASNRGIDEIRDLREKINFRPTEATYKVYIIDEVHMLTKEAFNALLKTLEEPPAHAVFVLATTEPDRVPETVRSRCQRFDFRRIPTAEIVQHLNEILKTEGAQAEQEALVAIARRSTGSMRDAISLLDQLLSYGNEKLTLARVEQVLGLVNLQTIGRLVDNIVNGETGPGLALLNELVAEGVELSQLVDQVVAYLRGVLFVRVAQTTDAVDLPQDVLVVMTRQATHLTTPGLLSAIREFTDARAALKDQVPGVPQLPLEIAFLRAAGASRSQETAAVAAPATAHSVEAPTTAQPAAASTVQPAASAPGSPAPTPTTSSSPARERPPEAAPQARPAAAAASSSPSAAASRPEEGASTEQKSTRGGDAASPDAGGDLVAVVKDRENWSRFLSVVKVRHGVYLQAALRGIKQVDVSGNTLVLGFTAQFQREMVDLPENRAKVEDALREVLGRKVNVRCVMAGDSIATAEPADAPNAVPQEDVLVAEARKRGAKVTRLD